MNSRLLLRLFLLLHGAVGWFMKKEQFEYRTYADFLADHFRGKVQKIGIDAGFSCPNRDGSISKEGCAFCNNESFVPKYCSPRVSISEQLQQGICFFRRKYSAMSYLAYFQAYTGTYAPIEILRKRYEEALSVPGVVGLVIATRPDCLSEDVLDFLSELSQKTFVHVEIGIETVHDRTLRLIGRGHDYQCAADAVERLASRGIKVGGHMILGLPSEDESDILEQARRIAHLPLDTLKLHQLQIIRNTPMAKLFHSSPELFIPMTPLKYASLVLDYIALLPATIALDRFLNQSPPNLLETPGWGIKNYHFNYLLNKEWQRRRLRETHS